MNDELLRGVGAVQFVERGVPVTMTVPISKGGVNAERRTVRGLMSQQIVDAHDEEVDFQSLVAALDTWKGNIREMHMPVAVGRAVDVLVREDLKGVEVESFISLGAQDTWLKCVDGTLGFYSIGGVGDRIIGTRSDGSRGPRILMTRLNELSLVDSGSCPTATISVAKMVGDALVAQLPGEPGLSASADRPIPAPVTGPAASLLSTIVRKDGAFRSESYDIYQATCALQCLETLIVNEAYESPVESGGADNTAQIGLLRMAAQIVLDFLMTEFDQQFGDANAVAMAIDRLPNDAQKTVVKGFVEKKGARHSKTDVAMIQKMHDSALALGAACGGAMEKTEPVAKPDVTNAPAVEAAVETATVTKAAEAISAAATVVAGVTAVTAPVVAGVEKAAAGTPAPAAGVPGVQVGGLETVDQQIQKAIGLVQAEFTKQLAEQKATSDTTIAKLQERVEKLAAEPTPGGPVANAHATAVAVDKAIAGGLNPLMAADTDAVIAGEVVKALIEVGKSITEPAQREALALKVVKLQQQHGLDATLVPMPSGR